MISSSCYITTVLTLYDIS